MWDCSTILFKEKKAGVCCDEGLNSLRTFLGLDCPHPGLPRHFLTFLRRPLCRILIQLQTDKLFLIFSFHPAWRLGSKNQYQLAGDQAASDWCEERAESESKRTGGGERRGGRRTEGSLTKYHELLAGGPKGCDFSGLEQGTLGMPLEQLGHELTAVEVPLERDRKRRVFSWSLNGRQGGRKGAGRARLWDSVSLWHPLWKGLTALAPCCKADISF